MDPDPRGVADMNDDQARDRLRQGHVDELKERLRVAEHDVLMLAYLLARFGPVNEPGIVRDSLDHIADRYGFR